MTSPLNNNKVNFLTTTKDTFDGLIINDGLRAGAFYVIDNTSLVLATSVNTYFYVAGNTSTESSEPQTTHTVNITNPNY
jgi:hypothetical protein